MPAANPLGGGTAYASAGLSSSQNAPGQATVGGSANLTVAGLVAASLLILVAMHIAGFRFAFDVSVGRH
jgi:hypothetical protein